MFDVQCWMFDVQAPSVQSNPPTPQKNPTPPQSRQSQIANRKLQIANPSPSNYNPPIPGSQKMHSKLALTLLLLLLPASLHAQLTNPITTGSTSTNLFRIATIPTVTTGEPLDMAT